MIPCRECQRAIDSPYRYGPHLLCKKCDRKLCAELHDPFAKIEEAKREQQRQIGKHAFGRGDNMAKAVSAGKNHAGRAATNEAIGNWAAKGRVRP